MPEMESRVGYVVKRYPRFSETFIVNELLAHEAAGLDLEIFSLRPPNDTHFQDIIAHVRAPVTYLKEGSPSASALWSTLQEAEAAFPGVWTRLCAGATATGPAGGLRAAYPALQLALAAHARGITHLHAHFATDAASVARLAAGIAGIAYTCTVHAKDIYHESVDPVALRQKLRDAAAVVTVSDYNVEFLRGQYGRDATRVTRIYNGLNLDAFSFAPPRQRAPRILAVGRLVEKKGFADLIDACRLLHERGRRFTCRIVGAGPLEPDLRRRVQAAGLGGTVEVLGPRPQAEVIAEIRAAAVFAAPCVVGEDGNRDGLPTVLLEAMALGTPCVATDVTGIPEIVRDGETGLIVPQHDPAVLAATLERLLDDEPLRCAMAARARRLIEAEFDIVRNTARQRELFVAAARRAATEAA